MTSDELGATDLGVTGGESDQFPDTELVTPRR